MRSYGEYLPCSCGAWARIVRAEDRRYRDKIVCAQCGRVTIDDNIPTGRSVKLKEDEDDKNGDCAEIGVKKCGDNDDDRD